MAAITRRDWMRWIGMVVPGAAVLSACQKSGLIDFQDAAIDAPMGTPMAEILDNHPHAPHDLNIPPADVAAGVDKTYVFRNCANHCHMVTVTAADFKNMLAGMTVMETSTMDVESDGTPDLNAHNHVVKFKLNACPDTTAYACVPAETCNLADCGSGS